MIRRLRNMVGARIKPIPTAQPDDYNAINAYTAARFLHPLARRVLVIGCNTGLDCRYFVDLGAGRVHGVDVVDGVGRDFGHWRTTYHQMSVEDMSFPDGMFDIVYSFATMEHVPRIDLAFKEMVRVLKSGGLIYSVAAPLWNSPYGHHMGNFIPDMPWIHLRMSRDEIMAHCSQRGLVDVEHRVNYMLDDRYFNKTWAREYIETCSGFRELEFVQNALAKVPEDLLTDEVFIELQSKGYSRAELLSTIHTLIAFKR